MGCEGVGEGESIEDPHPHTLKIGICGALIDFLGTESHLKLDKTIFCKKL